MRDDQGRVERLQNLEATSRQSHIPRRQAVKLHSLSDSWLSRFEQA